MATAKKLPSGSWRCQVYSHTEESILPDGSIKKKRIYQSFTSPDPTNRGKREAEALAAAWAMDKEKKDLSKSNMTFKEALEQYIKERSEILSPATIRKYKSLQRNKFERIERIKLKDIDQNTVQNFINYHSATLSSKSIRDLNGLVTAVMKRFYPNTVLNTTLPKKEHTKLYIPSENDIQRLIAAVKDTEMELPVLLGAFGALRRGEISALTKTDFNGNVIHVSKTMAYSDTGEWIVKAPKSYSGDRFVTIPPSVADKFQKLPGNGIGLTPNKITSRFEHILRSAGIPHFRFHDLRHYNASIKHALGIPDAYIMKDGGWGNDRVLKEVYRHTFEETHKKMNDVAITHFETMQHEMQHENKKAQ